ncbi:hypothetical protein Syun_025072 [Stephania yunnanensis]|uniref:Uncharacterized protein n=1 Tax=Stephania yunnanensis TaxID=152371 RepID=A0AAP0EWA7_9MAGN
MNDLIFREPTFQQSHQHEHRTIADIERNMISDWLSQSTTQQPLQEDMQYMKSKLQNSETQVTAILEHLMDEEELPPQPVFDSDETVNADTSKSVEFDEFSIVDEHLSEPEETLDASSHEPDITIAQYDDDEAEKEIEVISERSEEPQKENKEDQPLVLVKPPTLPCIFVRPCKGVEVKERSRIFYTADTFVLDDHDSTDSFVLEVPNELRTLKEGMHAELPKAIGAPFVVDITKGEGITFHPLFYILTKKAPRTFRPLFLHSKKVSLGSFLHSNKDLHVCSTWICWKNIFSRGARSGWRLNLRGRLTMKVEKT